jgi:hypothetical protein
MCYNLVLYVNQHNNSYIYKFDLSLYKLFIIILIFTNLIVTCINHSSSCIEIN